jgi:hypothetical protein
MIEFSDQELLMLDNTEVYSTLSQSGSLTIRGRQPSNPNPVRYEFSSIPLSSL